MSAERAFIFPGQGSQKVGMGTYGPHFPDELRTISRDTFQQANDTLHMDIAKLCYEGSAEVLNQTRLTQPALVVASVAALRMLRHMEVEPGMVAGHSLGEYSALVAAEAISFEQALLLVRARGEAMERAGKMNPGSMAAVLNLPYARVQEICDELGVEIANINAPGQIVIAGKSDAIEYASSLDVVGGRIQKLNVSIASHCSLMEPARLDMQMELGKVPIQDPRVPFYANVSGEQVTSADVVRRGLVDQLTHQVHWLETIGHMRDAGGREFIEVGPGSVLTGLLKRIDGTLSRDNTDAIFKQDNLLQRSA